MPGARCRVHGAGVATAPDFASGDGSLPIAITASTTSLALEWAPSDTPLSAPFPFRRRYHVDLGGNVDEQVSRRLNNLGFSRLLTVDAKIRGFQRTYGMPVDGRAESALGVLGVYHDVASLPPFIEVPDPERPGLTKRQPGPPLPPDLRPPSQGCVAAVEELEPRTCHFSFMLFDERNEEPIPNASYMILDGLTVVHYGQTDSGGRLEYGDVPGGDYLLHIRGAKMMIPAIGKDETMCRLLLLPTR
jgi:hypothetical protein